jgi:hypothetical protein
MVPVVDVVWLSSGEYQSSFQITPEMISYWRT